jgi:hypothetical protein
MSWLDRAAGASLAAALLAALAWASQAPMTASRSDGAVLRLAWSALPERIEECRERTPQELSQLPQHMRQPVVCEGTTATYRLQVRLDAATVVDRIVQGGGLRHDRRLYVLDEVPVRPGEVEVDVRFDRIEKDRAVEAPSSGPAARRGEHVPSTLRLERRLQFSPREVILVTYSPEERALVRFRGRDEFQFLPSTPGRN